MLTRRARPAPAILACALLLAAAAGCTAPGPAASSGTPTPAPATASTASATPAAPATPVGTALPTPGQAVTFAVVGDSLSLGSSPDFEGGVVAQDSWVAWAEDRTTTFVGGTAVVGATSWAQADRAFPVEADALVLALGTNDMSAGAPFEATADALVEIADTVGAPRVLVLSVPPRRYETEPTTAEFNGWLQGLAAEYDWEFVDSSSTVREGEAWADGMTGDGIHYTRAAVPLVGAYVGDALRGVPR